MVPSAARQRFACKPREGQRREMAETAAERRGVSIALACRAFGVSETCYLYSPKLKDENEVIADLLTGPTDARKTWGFGLCFLHLRNVKGEVVLVFRPVCGLVKMDQGFTSGR
jgi:hypothetical protein